jgi:hypothetical protein
VIERLGEVLDQIGVEFLANFDAPTEVPLYKVGNEDEVARATPAYRVVMEPTTRQLEAATQAIRNPADGTMYRVIYVRVENVRCHIWGRTMSEAEELEEILINAIQKCAAASIRPGSGTWDLPTTTERGFVILQDISFLIPIVRREGVRAVLTSLPITAVIEPPPS